MPDAETMTNILEEHVCPIIGAILSTLTFAAPMRTLSECLKDGDLKSVNPMPWVFMTGNTIGWLAYSYVTLDIYVCKCPPRLCVYFLHTALTPLLH